MADAVNDEAGGITRKSLLSALGYCCSVSHLESILLMSSKGSITVNWDDHHTLALFRGIINNTMSTRANLYAIPELQEVANNGGDRINKKMQQLLQKLAVIIPGGEGLVKEEVGKVSRGPRKAKDGGQAEKKAGTSSPGKRKRSMVHGQEGYCPA